MSATGCSFARLLVLLVWAAACTSPRVPIGSSSATATSDTLDARRLFEENIDAIHKRDRLRYLATYLHTDALARNGPAGLELGYANWSARRDSTWPDTLIARNLRVLPLAPGVVYGAYCYTVSQNDTTSSGVSERVFVKTTDGWRIAVTTAFGLPAGALPRCK
jgi:hypothetical protein